MILDARSLDADSLRADLAIIGAGAAGLTIAHELEGSGMSVLLIDSGGLRLYRKPQSLSAAESVGLRSFSARFSRYRCLGGSTTQWGGQCRPLDEIDFEPRDEDGWAWPFGRDELLPHYRRAAAICRLPAGFDDTTWNSGPSAFSGADGDLEKITYLFAYPTDFGVNFRPRLAASDDVRVLLGATVTHIQLAQKGGTVSGLTLLAWNGRQLKVSAGLTILAGGGIENARLLLASNDVAKRGIGNESDLVGRYFNDHPYAFVGTLVPKEPHPEFDELTIDSYDGVGISQKRHAALTLRDVRIRRQRLNKCSMYLLRRPHYKTTPDYFSPPGLSLNFFVDLLRRRETVDRPLTKELLQLLKGADRAIVTTGRAIQHALRPKEVLAVRIAMESRPLAESRITLSNRRDWAGKPLARIDWRLHEADRLGLRALLDTVADALAKSGLGDLREIPWDENTGWPRGMTGGKHHMGTTRMHADSDRGVVNADGRVHGIDNLYISGSSLFPTGGYANPTFTLVALAVRLAAHLKRAAVPR